ncbi:MAG: hypothetical protein MUF31_11300 [Akkermansiaceae bacterium]|jgi:HEAT repeat protein|nr:hypothetical protein [Akkermansiaceae bacterium]
MVEYDSNPRDSQNAARVFQEAENEELLWEAGKILARTESGRDALRSFLSNPSREKRLVAYFALSQSGELEDGERGEILRMFMDSGDPESQVAAIYSAINHNIKSLPMNLFEKLCGSSDSWLSAWAHIYVAHAQSEEEITTLRGYTKSDNSWLRELACCRIGDLLGSLPASSHEFALALADLRSLLKDPVQQVRASAELELDLLSDTWDETKEQSSGSK